MVTFRFELRPLDEVSPWGRDQPTLHWFGMTEGWYWLEVGGHELLRRTRLDDPYPYVDYYVARLWEDMSVLTPDVLEAVPADLQPFIASDPTQWARDPLVSVTTGGEDTVGHVGLNQPDQSVVTASNWHAGHYLDLGYLRNAPHLRFWRTVHGDRDEITVDWQHTDDGEIGFTAGPALRSRVPSSTYVEAVQTLDRELMRVMLRRVEELERRGGLPGVDLDLAGLRREHEDRTQWLAKSLDRTPTTDWDAVRQGADRLLGSLDQDRTPLA